MTTDIATLRNDLKSGNVTIGAFVYWNHLDGCRVDRALFKMGVKSCDLGSALSADPKPEKTLNDAAKIAARRQSRGDAARIKLKAKDDKVVTYAVQMHRPAGGKMNHLEEATVSLVRHDADPIPWIEVDPAAPLDDKRTKLLAEMLEAYGELRSYVTSEEVSTTLVAAMGLLGAISLRTGAYFVPASGLDQVTRLQEFLATSVGVHLASWDVTKTTRNAAEAKVTAQESFTAKLREVIADVEAFTTSIANDETVSARSIVAKARKFRDLDDHVSLYTDVLGDYQAELQAAIAAAKERLLGAYLGDIDAGAVDADEPGATDAEDEAAA